MFSVAGFRTGDPEVLKVFSKVRTKPFVADREGDVSYLGFQRINILYDAKENQRAEQHSV